MTTKNNKKLGPRVTVLFAATRGSKKSGKKGSASYVYMLKRIADAMGFTIVKNPLVTRANKSKSGKTVKVNVRGSVGAKRIKVPVPGDNDGKQNYYSIPVPANANITTIKAFLGKAKKKVSYFVSPDGRSIPLAETKGRK